MTDFMHRLASRALGDPPALSPRLPSWFEPVAGTAIAPAFEASDARTPHAMQQAIAPPEPQATMPPQPQTNTERTPVTPARQATPSAQTPPQSVAARHIASAEHGLSAIDTRQALHPAKAEPAPTTPNPAPAPSTVLRPATVAVPVRAEIAKADAPARPTPPTGVLLPPPAPVFPSTRRDGAPRDPSAEPRARGRDSAAGRTAPPAEPVVHVSIGRIEVRAAPAPAAAPSRRREERASGGLDDYLRQRQGKAAP